MHGNRADFHLHSSFSYDSEEPMERYCERALELGVDSLCFTEHIENNPRLAHTKKYNRGAYFEEVRRLNNKYAGRLHIFTGVEFESPHLYDESFREVLTGGYDFVMASVHIWYENMFISELKKNISAQSAYEAYWNSYERMIQRGGFDAVAHMDFPRRYYGELHYDRTQMERIFTLMVEQGIVPEINTSTYRKGQSEPMPAAELLEIYTCCGGRYVTLGSDAHTCDVMCDGIDRAIDEMEKHGLKPVYFKNRTLTEI